MIKSQKQIDGIRHAGLININALDEVKRKIRIGMSSQDIDDIVYKAIANKGGQPATLGFHGYKKSSCVSINHEVCHGIPSHEVFIEDGDLINVDVATVYNGYYADSARVFTLGNINEETDKLKEISKLCIDEALKYVKPGVKLGKISYVVNQFAKSYGYSVVQVIGGHGIGNDFHEEPWVGFDLLEREGEILKSGMVFTIEPAINQGSHEVIESTVNDWTILTRDNKLSAQWEVTVLVTDNAYELLAY